jgi:hypothetical protein
MACFTRPTKTARLRNVTKFHTFDTFSHILQVGHREIIPWPVAGYGDAFHWHTTCLLSLSRMRRATTGLNAAALTPLRFERVPYADIYHERSRRWNVLCHTHRLLDQC